VDHKSVAQRVLKDVGGAGNIVAAAHCATRLRLVLKNQDKVDQAAIDNDEDLKGSFLNAGQFQIIVGPGDVNEVHKHLIAAGAPEASKDDLKEIASKQGNIVSRFIKTIADIFVPLIPVLVGGGMLMAINSVLTSKGIFGPESFIAMHPEWADFADIINLLSAAPFAFLPVLVGFSATKVFGGNPYLGLTMGAAMVSPALMNGYNVAASLAGAEGTDPMKYWNLFGLQVQQAGYQGTVLPIMLVAFILSHVEKFFHKVLRGTIDFIFTPTLTILITGFLTFLLVGPPMFQLGTWLGEGVNWLYTVAGPLGGLGFVGFSLVQGLAFIALKTDGDIRHRARNTLVRWSPVLLLPIVAWVLALDFTTGNGISWLCTILAVVAVLIAWISAKGGREGRAFAGLSVFLAFGALAIFTAMYPNVLPSTLDPAYSLTIANASSSEYTLGVMTFVTCLGLPVVFVYQAWTYWVFCKRLHVDHIPEAHDATELAELPTK